MQLPFSYIHVAILNTYNFLSQSSSIEMASQHHSPSEGSGNILQASQNALDFPVFYFVLGTNPVTPTSFSELEVCRKCNWEVSDGLHLALPVTALSITPLQQRSAHTGEFQVFTTGRHQYLKKMRVDPSIKTED